MVVHLLSPTRANDCCICAITPFERQGSAAKIPGSGGAIVGFGDYAMRIWLNRKNRRRGMTANEVVAAMRARMCKLQRAIGGLYDEASSCSFR